MSDRFYLRPGWPGRVALWVPLGSYLFVYPVGLLLLLFGLMPPGAAWVGTVLLLAQATAMVVWLLLNFAPRRALAATLLVGAISWALEAVGVTTGFPFGQYTYTAALGSWLGPVPLAIPFAWIATLFGALFTAWMLADVGGMAGRRAIALVGALLTTAQDFVLEPVATTVQGYWQWQGEGFTYGVPWQNFATWFVASFLLGYLALLLLGESSQREKFSWLPPLLLLLAAFMFGLLDLTRGYWLAALVALPLIIISALGVLRDRLLGAIFK